MNVVKQQVWALADELNSILRVPLIEPDQRHCHFVHFAL